MTQNQYLIQRKLNVVDLAKTLGNISESCRRLGVSRQHYYDIKTALKEDGIEGLVEKSRRVPRMRNRVARETEDRLLQYGLEFPTHGQTRVSNELLKEGISISPFGVRSVWARNGMLSTKDRLRRLEKYSADSGAVLTESQVAALEEAKQEKELCGEIETFHPGFLLGQDTLYVGYIKGVGKIYQQTAIDTYSNIGFAKVYTDKTPLPAADLLNDRVLPFFEEHGLRLLRVLTDRGTEYCGVNDAHQYELYLHLNDIEHSRTKVKHPQTNGSTEKLNQTVLKEFYQTAFRKKLYRSLDEIQVDLDEYMRDYNNERTNQGKRCKGRTPMETFQAGIELYHQYVHNNSLEEKPEIN
jgi:transposase InsO family protein